MMLALPALAWGRGWYVAPDGNDSAKGAISSPLATLAAAQKKVAPGDTVYFREGTYRAVTDEAMGEFKGIYSCAYMLDKSGTEKRPIVYTAFPGERVVFDMSEFRPEGKRVSAFMVTGSWLRLKGFEVVGTQVTIANGSNTQSECFSNQGDNNVYENLKMHDGMGIGWYLVKGSNNLVLNCDAWCNYDPLNGGGNVDGFGCHPKVGDVGNVLRGCRAWWNSDDGFDLINSNEAVRIENCWALYNGYKPGTTESAADGNGLKAGGYGMKPNPKVTAKIPRHEVVNCVAVANKASGIYSNHHLGGILWHGNISVGNRYNYNMVNRKSVEEIVDVAGYGHILEHNYGAEARAGELVNCDSEKCVERGNSFGTHADLAKGLDYGVFLAPRQPDGTLPEVDFLRKVKLETVK